MIPTMNMINTVKNNFFGVFDRIFIIPNVSCLLALNSKKGQGTTEFPVWMVYLLVGLLAMLGLYMVFMRSPETAADVASKCITGVMQTGPQFG